MDTPENVKQSFPETLRGIPERATNYVNQVRELNKSARARLPKEIQETLSPMQLIGQGVAKTVLGLGIDLTEGALFASLTFGLSEAFPVTEYLVDMGANVAAEKLTGRKLRDGSVWLARGLNWIPVVGDFASATAFDGVADVVQGAKALWTEKTQGQAQVPDRGNLNYGN